MMENHLEEEATELLREYSRGQGKSLRKIGILDNRRMKLVQNKEIPMSSMRQLMRRKGGHDE